VVVVNVAILLCRHVVVVNVAILLCSHVVVVNVAILLCGHVVVVNVAILYKIHFTQMLGNLCCGAPFVVYVGHLQYVQYKCSVILFCMSSTCSMFSTSVVLFCGVYGALAVCSVQV
jgi:hypothetical protein